MKLVHYLLVESSSSRVLQAGKYCQEMRQGARVAINCLTFKDILTKVKHFAVKAIRKLHDLQHASFMLQYTDANKESTLTVYNVFNRFEFDFQRVNIAIAILFEKVFTLMKKLEVT